MRNFARVKLETKQSTRLLLIKSLKALILLSFQKPLHLKDTQGFYQEWILTTKKPRECF